MGAYPELNTRDDLWRLLVTITRTHAWKQGRFLTRKRRHMQHLHQLDRVVLREMANDRILPEVTAIMSDTLTALLKTLDQSDPELGDIARGRLEGLSNAELAEKHNRSQRTIERRIRLIQEIWQRHFEQPENESSD